MKIETVDHEAEFQKFRRDDVFFYRDTYGLTISELIHQDELNQIIRFRSLQVLSDAIEELNVKFNGRAEKPFPGWK